MSETTRAAFLSRIRERQGPPPAAGPHPPPEPPTVVPVMGYRNLDGDRSLVDVFVETATAAEATVDVVAGGGLAAAVEAFVTSRFDVPEDRPLLASASVESEVEPVVAALWDLGVHVEDYTPSTAAVADIAVTSATHGIAATGSIVVDSHSAGSRAVSLLPQVHLCVLPAERIVADPAAVLRHQGPMPSCRVVVTGPSRTGDIEQLLTLGAHGPVALHVIVTTS